MAWISGLLADKAENILNKIDQNVATALQQPAGSSNMSSSLDAISKSISSNTQSLKGALSPTKVIDHSIEAEADGDNEVNVNKDLNYEMGSVTIDISNEVGSTKVHTNDSMQDATVNIPKTNYFSIKDIVTSSDAELEAFKIALSEVTNERNELRLRLSELNREKENQDFKQRCQEFETLVQSLTKERDQIQRELQESQAVANAYVHSLSELETNLAKLQQEYVEVAQKLQIQTKETEIQRQELMKYRVKAQRALQLKDNVISELKMKGTSNSMSDESEMHVIQLELDAIKNDYKEALNENQNLKIQMIEYGNEVNELSKSYSEQLVALQVTEDVMRKELRMERERVLSAESENRVIIQEIETLRQQLSNHMAASATRLQEKEKQLELLRTESSTKKRTVDFNLEEYTTRVKTLTQALVDKQNSLESITAERNALRIQLEKLQDKLQQRTEFNSVNTSTPKNVLISNSTDDVTFSESSISTTNERKSVR